MSFIGICDASTDSGCIVISWIYIFIFGLNG